MTDSTLNSFLARGTNAQRVAFTPSPPTPASGPSPTYIWHETDTGDTYAYNGTSWDKVNTSSGGATASPVGMMALDGIDGEEGMPIPGAPGAAGAGAGGWPAATAPAQIGGLVGWWDASLLASPAGGLVSVLNSPDPRQVINPASNNANNSAIVVATAQINGLNAATFPGASTGSLVCSTGQLLSQSTAFVVHKPGAMPSANWFAFFSGLSNSLIFRLSQTSSNVAKLELLKAQVASIGVSSGTVATGTAFQANYTYNASTGAYAFRLGKAASGSGTNAVSITANTTNLGVEVTGLTTALNGDLAELIMYSRVLTPTEIASVEAYLTTKWGV